MSSQFALAPSVLVRSSSESLWGSLTYGCRRGGMRVDEFIVSRRGEELWQWISGGLVGYR